MIGTVEIRCGTLVAAEVDGIPDNTNIGQVTEYRTAYFAWRDEAQAWIAEQAAEGFAQHGFGGAAIRYFGPTDAESNAWFAEVSKVITPADAMR